MEAVSTTLITEEQKKPIFTLAGESNVTTTTDSFGFVDTRVPSVNQNRVSSPMTPMSGLRGNDLLNMFGQQEPRVADSAPSVAEMEELLTNMGLNGSEVYNEDIGLNSYVTAYNRPESSASVWSDNVQNAREDNDMMDSFDFVIKSLSSANNYVSMLTREQVAVLRSIRPGLLYELLKDVARVRGERRMRRALPNECAFCKNNGENEECYSSHALKDWRGRVLCPVLRAFRCPRCGATGDRAHTIKYCPEGVEIGSGSVAARRRVPPSASLLLGAGTVRHGPSPTAPSMSPVTSSNSPPIYSSLWSNFGMN